MGRELSSSSNPCFVVKAKMNSMQTVIVFLAVKILPLCIIDFPLITEHCLLSVIASRMFFLG